MSQLRRLAVGGCFLVSLAVVSCSYESTLRRGFHDAGTGLSEKIPLSVGLLNDAQLEKSSVDVTALHSVLIWLNPGLVEGARAELERVFASVDVIDESRLQDDFDLIAYPRAQFVETYRNEFVSEFHFRWALELELTDARTGMLVTVYGSEGQFEYNPSGLTRFLGILNAGTLLLFSPILIPLTTESIGSHAEGIVERCLSSGLTEVGAQLVRDRGRLAALEPANSLVDPPFAVGPLDAGGQTEDSYEPILQTVVVVQTATGYGSGFFVTPNGWLVTNAHVVEDSAQVEVTTREGESMVGRVVRKDVDKDLAFVEVRKTGTPYLRLGRGHVGEDVAAVGAPRGFSYSVTKGIISAYRLIESVEHIQTDAAINPGNSGGPVVSLKTGEVVGLSSWKRVDGEGLGFAVTSEEIRRLFPQLFE